ncbi:MAG: hypothetical protein HKP16_01455 [Xanthomonadales bacterium]|nr:hypothetical protein [Gammaproteobacteria bacterium]NNJ64201.1 hypothetical protein [Xanthomonadales bacterium]NNK31501.1 hypothetical protein [Xanthomonadales bacterium]
MIHHRMNEAAIDASLDARLDEAREGNLYEARRLHEMLDQMLMEKDTPEGRLWLTEHGKMLLADMHRQLSHCSGGGQELRESVLESVNLKPHRGKWPDTCSFIRDLRVATSVANELCKQRDDGSIPDLVKASEAVALKGEFEIDALHIQEVYDEVSQTIGGFREISRC